MSQTFILRETQILALILKKCYYIYKKFAHRVSVIYPDRSG